MEKSKADIAEQANIGCYQDYYDKPQWWFRFRYDTQVKRKTCLYLLKRGGKSTQAQKVLELGFGSGALLFSFDRNSEISGVEISRTAILEAIKNAQRLGYKRFDFQPVAPEGIQYEDCTFDIVVASHVLEHVRDDSELLREIHRVLKTDGIAVILVPINENYEDHNHVRSYTQESLVHQAQRCGFFTGDVLENETLFHLVETFYFENYNTRWRMLGPLVAAAFNFPLSTFPFFAYRVIDRAMISLGFKPRQVGVVLKKEQSSPYGVD